MAAARTRAPAACIQDLRAARAADDRRHRDRAAPQRLDRLPLVVLGDDRARAHDVGDRPDRLDRRRAPARAGRIVARLAHGVRVVRSGGAALRAPDAASSRQPRADDGEHGRRHRRHRRDDRIPLFTFRRGARPDPFDRTARVAAAADPERVPAVRRLRGRDDRGLGRPQSVVGPDLPPGRHRAPGELRHPEHHER